MAEIVKGLDVSTVLANLANKTLSKIDLSRAKLPEASAEVELGDDTKKLLKVGLGLAGLWIVYKMFLS